MKKLCFIALCSLTFGALTQAQTGPARDFLDSPIDFASTSAAHVSLLDTPFEASAKRALVPSSVPWDSLSSPSSTSRLTTFDVFTPAALFPSAPSPSPSPAPGAYDVLRWQLTFGVAFERFRSNLFSASAVGVNTTLTYFFSDWLGLDGEVSATFAPTILQNEHIKLVNYGVGPRIAWRGRQWEPFAHVVVGGTHALPQTAGNSQNGFLLKAGGGVDYRLWPALSLRAQADYLRTGLFGTSQNNLFLSAGFVFNF
jgi:opacity protein-like surface antigen